MADDSAPIVIAESDNTGPIELGPGGTTITLRPVRHAGRAVTSQHFNDAAGNPAGGTTFGPGFAIGWQNGPLGRGEDRKPQNGAFVEDVIAAAIDRIEYYQASKFASPYNASAVAYLELALGSLAARTIDREVRQVEGTHEA